MRKALWTALPVLLLATWVVGQTQEQYLDVYVAQVKPEKRADFDALTKKMVAANHQNNGDNWITTETVYGPNNRVSFVSMRQSYGDTEKASDLFYQALLKAYGKPATDKMFQEFSQCVVSTQSEFRRRRWDLSSNPPADAAALAKMIASSRWLRTSTIHVRAGQGPAFEEMVKQVKAAREKASPSLTTLVSQAVAGQEGNVYYVTTLAPSMAAFDGMPSIEQLLGQENYAQFLKANAETVADVQMVISRFLPELSNAPADVVAAAPDYWRPKTTVAQVKATKPPAVNAASTTKMEDKK